MPASPAANPLPDPHRHALDELVEIGMGLARWLKAATEVGAVEPVAAVEAFELVSRAVRRTIALAARMRAGEPFAPVRAASPRPTVRPDRSERPVSHDRPDVPEREDLFPDLRERLNDEDEIDGRPTSEIVADICRTLEIDPAPYQAAFAEDAELAGPDLDVPSGYPIGDAIPPPLPVPAAFAPADTG